MINETLKLSAADKKSFDKICSEFDDTFNYSFELLIPLKLKIEQQDSKNIVLNFGIKDVEKSINDFIENKFVRLRIGDENAG